MKKLSTLLFCLAVMACQSKQTQNQWVKINIPDEILYGKAFENKGAILAADFMEMMDGQDSAILILKGAIE